MITFLPVKSFVKSMEALDNKRLGQQRRDAVMILEIITGKLILPKDQRPIGKFDPTLTVWQRHPSVQMWVGHEEWLKLYIACAIGEWEFRGYSNSIPKLSYDTKMQEPPKWLGYELFHQSHRSNLVRRFPQFYRRLWPGEDADLIYFWPTLRGFDVSDPSQTRKIAA